MKNKILVVDKHLIKKNNDYYNDLINIFPMHKNDGAYRTSLSNLKKRSKLQSNFYKKIYPKLKKIYFDNELYNYSEFNIVFNQIFVKFTNIFIDHYIRINFRLKQKGAFKVMKVNKINTEDSHSFFLTFASSWHANQYLSMKICNTLNIESKKIKRFKNYPELLLKEKIKNVIFAPYGSIFTNIKRRITTIKIICSKFLGKIINLNKKILSAGFSSDEYYFAKNGAYGPLGFFYRINDNYPDIIRTKKNINKRKKIKEQITEDIENLFFDFLKQINQDISKKESKNIFMLWNNLVLDWFPIFLFENYQQNIENYKLFLKKNKFNKYLIGEPSTLIDNDRGLLLSLSVRNLNGKILGIQHSAGHFGYIDDLSFGNYFEYSHYDKYFTFGWNQTNSYLPKSEFIKMPCPKLSSSPLKNNFLKNKNKFLSKKDILFLSNTLSRFPMGGTCGHARIDFVDQILKSQSEMINFVIKNKISIIHKPYNVNVRLLFKDHFNSLESIDSSLYSLLNINQKGLTIDLIKKAKIILWDQIGSGTVEAFASKIPSIIFWNRIYSNEATWSKKNIYDLHKCGILHYNLDTLVLEIKNYVNDPQKWFNDKEKIKAIKSFCISYANYDINWYNLWKRKINNLENEY